MIFGLQLWKTFLSVKVTASPATFKRREGKRKRMLSSVELLLRLNSIVLVSSLLQQLVAVFAYMYTNRGSL